jgi:hypothetical protein
MEDPLRARLQHAVEGDYAIVRLLGRGAMGAVYLAREHALDRLVAIKVLPPDASVDQDRRTRFRREAQLAAKLSHPNIAPLHRFGESAGLAYYLMGFVRGESLADRLRRDGRIPADEARRMLAQLADALEYAHGKGVIHRDIKPDNILLDDETGRPLITDFGIARTAGDGSSADAGRIEGTAHYMSPEQATGGVSSDGRSDIYSLGVVGYVMLAGQTPLAAATFADFLREQATADPRPLASLVADMPPDLDAIIMRALARDPGARWPTARALKDALGAGLDDDPDYLPGELRELAGAAFYSLFAGWMIGSVLPVFLRSLLPVWLLVLPAVVPVLAFLLTALVHHRKGFTWAELWRASTWPPGWWLFWWPQQYRRPGDVWHRLPAAVRVIRAAYASVLLPVVLFLPVILRLNTLQLVWVLGGVYAAITALMLITAWWAYRGGVPNNADLRSLVFRSTSDRRFWKRPRMAERLLPVGAPAVSAQPPATPAECVRQMSEAAVRMHGQTREAGVEAVEVARLVYAAIGRLDTSSVAAIEDRGELSTPKAANRRSHLVSRLGMLWEAQNHLSRDGSEAAAARLAALVRVVSAELDETPSLATGSDALTLGATGARPAVQGDDLGAWRDVATTVEVHRRERKEPGFRDEKDSI